MKYQFTSDYSEGAHPDCLAALAEGNMDQEAGYGNDSISQKAKALIRQAIDQPDADIQFIAGGTLVNLTCLSAMLTSVEGVVAASTGHIYSNETGAIEATGHKVFNLPTEDGKLNPDAIQELLNAHRPEVNVRVKVVYISVSTEFGTLYSLSELQRLRELCDAHKLYLYIDGARLAQALASQKADFTLQDIGRLADAFYIGGTKNGALLGEALVITHDDIKKHFRYHMKQKGAIVAKGRVIGSQFLALFQNNQQLYFALARHANDSAMKLQSGLQSLGVPLLFVNHTNMIFPVFTQQQIEQLQKDYAFHVWKKMEDGMFAVRLVTSWATKEDAVEWFLTDAAAIMNQS